MERAVLVYATVQLLIIGLSHLLQPRAWAEFFILLREKGAPGVFATAFLSLVFGSVIVGFHRVWSGIPLVLTLLGIAQVLKAAIYLCFPGFALRKLHRVSLERAWEFQVAGAALLVLAGLFLYELLRSG
ncbi:MAG TPA: hypothetical protein VF121_08055 [Thermoanaerobaculia bacterium]|nr:hypothetical protein [Thermoanaerobaculia bacterium]